MQAIIRILRIPNLVIIALTFCIIRYLVFIPVLSGFSESPQMTDQQFLIMVIATMIIAAAGYIANDYFDVVTDRINKPAKQFIGNQISPGSALASAILLSIVAISLSIWLSIKLESVVAASLLILALLVTWWYAIRLKKSFLWGNVAVASLSAGTIAMAWLVEKQTAVILVEPSGIITRIILAISTFAFLLSMLREIIKDIEDIEGDKLTGCKSLPVIKGISVTKNTLFVFSGITFALLLITQLFLVQYSKYISTFWLFAFVEIPLIIFITSLVKAESKSEFHRLSSLLKWIMVGGILSIVAGQF
jgi:4-hydroxybenzoate polyprenyltransferase